ncbi:hypothetical protein [Pelolinea submarina]|uniref:HEAT repeat protein n=1 Tax=Pelolinea submarina TaxID=913107 RepID=A0A347ZPB7_9CHLR|nr:hypothetical protein [Pelolinea submarina]REG08749.1 hypothetical protein DFR64_2124 [Pelolinea submarina]BBB47148.1 hypothetical protein Pelsub_P0375 [Pelolinea submarina]
MENNELIAKIAVKDFDLEAFARLAVEDKGIRDELVSQMIANPDIMVYYHCYEVLSKASQAEPQLFYPYWPDIAPLLDHPNSYHRDFALTILANLTQVDHQDLFASLADQYVAHINDAKFCTGQYCVRNCQKIITYKPETLDFFLDRLFDLDTYCDYPAKQKDLLKYDVLVILEQVYDQSPRKDQINAFIRTASKAVSPKTRKKADALVRKFSIQVLA